MRAAGGRVLALDLGEVRIGLAISDSLRITAQPVGNLERRSEKATLEKIREMVELRDVVRVLVGYPLLLSGETGTRAMESRKFAERLGEALGGVPVELWDERLTTAQADKAMISGNVKRRRRREVIDALAAVLILQSWLDSRPSPDVSD